MTLWIINLTSTHSKLSKNVDVYCIIPSSLFTTIIFFKRATTVHLQEPSMPFCGILNELIKTLCGKKWVKNRPKMHSNHGGGHCNVFTIKLGLKTESPWKKIMFYLLQNVCIRNTGSATMFQPDLEKNKNTNNKELHICQFWGHAFVKESCTHYPHRTTRVRAGNINFWKIKTTAQNEHIQYVFTI